MALPARNPMQTTESYPRVVERPPLPPAYVIEEEQIPTIMTPWQDVEAVPASSFVDVHGHVHIEYGNIAFDPSKEKRRVLQWFVDPLKYFRRIAPKVVEGSLLNKERQLIGGATFHYFPKKSEVYVQYWGIFSAEQARERGIDTAVLKEAAAHHHAVMDAFHHRLGIQVMKTTSSVEACIKRLRQFGWEEYRPSTWKERWGLFTGTFPVSLRHRERLFRKFYR